MNNSSWTKQFAVALQFILTSSLRVIFIVKEEWCYKCQPFPFSLKQEFVTLLTLGVRHKGWGFLSNISWQCSQEYASGFLLLFPGTCTDAGVLSIRNVRLKKAFAAASCCSCCFKYFYTWGFQEYSLVFSLFATGVTELEHAELCSKLLAVLWLPCSSQRATKPAHLPHTHSGFPHSSAAAGAAGKGLHLAQGWGGPRSHSSVNPALAHRHCPPSCHHAAALRPWLRRWQLAKTTCSSTQVHAGKDVLSLRAGTGAAPEAVSGSVHCSHLSTGCWGVAAAQLMDFCWHLCKSHFLRENYRK